MPNRGDRVYVDTNAIIESHRVKCWKDLVSRFGLCTVEKCVEECATGNLAGAETPVDVTELRSKITVESVSSNEIAQLNLKLSNQVILDPGEEHLIAKAIQQKEAWFLCSPDKAAIRAVSLLNLAQRLISLEELAGECGLDICKKAKVHYLKGWLKQQKTLIEFEILEKRSGK
ncbi:MAG: hypothetical protein LV481_07895 [Methylacidiphilales bacterium]|nr:hypothetical protein [Candidatus Methylacidiphilales bacterium]